MKHIIDPIKGQDKDTISHIIKRTLYGVEVEEETYNKCIENLNNVLRTYGIDDFDWSGNILNQSAFNIPKEWFGTFKYVIGNPPYIRTHNIDKLDQEVMDKYFSDGGMTDYYIAFFHLGFDLLTDDGRLCYITPRSWLNSKTGRKLRDKVREKQTLAHIIDFRDEQIFDNVSTYTVISLFDLDYDVKANGARDVLYDKGQSTTTIQIDEFSVQYGIYPSFNDDFINIMTYNGIKYVSVKNGFATNADNVFISDNIIDSFITIPCYKGRTGKYTKCLFPYNGNGELIEEEVVYGDENLLEYFNKHREKLLGRNCEAKPLYRYGRTQAIRDVNKERIALSDIMKNLSDLKLEKIPAGVGIYSSLYIVPNNTELDMETIREILMSEKFYNFISALGNYKRGGYLSFTSKDVERFINYRLSTM